jgi:aldehyde:ferredoxin oxidoreductase
MGSRTLGVEGPEYETAALLGSNCGINRIEDVVYANYLCDNLGLDTISAGNVAAFTMECFQRGLISRADLGGLEPTFGDPEALFHLIRMMASREGLGDTLAEGVKAASKRFGPASERFAMQVKGLEISGYDSRAAQAMGLAYATADIGAHHNRAWAITYDIKMGRTTYTRDKIEWVIHLQHMRPLFDCLGTCRLQWVELGMKPEYYSAFYTQVTGIRKTLPDLLKTSEMIYNLTRAINITRGMPATEDWLPDRIFDDPVPTGVVKGSTLEREKFKAMLLDYYELRGWNSDGSPSKGKLVELGLEDVANRLNLH